MDDRGSITGWDGDFFLFAIVFRPAVGSTQLPIQWLTGDSFPGGKATGREANHQPPT